MHALKLVGLGIMMSGCIDYFAEPPDIGAIADGGTPTIDSSPPDAMTRLPGPGCAQGDGDQIRCEKACGWLGHCAVSDTHCPGYDLDDRAGVVDRCRVTCLMQPLLATLVCPHTMCQQTIDFINGQSETFRTDCLGGEGAG